MYEHKTFTDEEIKELVVKAFDCKIFTSYQCKPDDIGMIFMPIMFINSPPTEPHKPKSDDIKEHRKNKLDYIKEKEHYDTVVLPNWKENIQPKIQTFLEDVGMLYESYDKALPTGINGYPIFASCGFMSKNDSSRFLDCYGKYQKMREELDKQF